MKTLKPLLIIISLMSNNRIKSVSTTSEEILVILNTSAPAHSSISITSIDDANPIVSCTIPEGDSSISVDSKSLANGMYIVNYCISSRVVDAIKISLK